MDRRSALRLGSASLAGALAGCATLSTGPPAVDPHTGLARNPRANLAETPVALAGETGALPTPPETAPSLAAAHAVIATPGAATEPLAAAFRDGTAVAFAGSGAPAALAGLLEAVREDYHYGLETVSGRPVEVAVAEPRGDTVRTAQFVREGGWDDPVLDPVGWALDGRVPDCETFVPERSSDAQYERLGSAWLAGRLPGGETYAARTVGSRYAGDEVDRFRLRSALHAAASGGYAVGDARRVADFANDEAVVKWFPNPHTQNGVRVSNQSAPVEERLDVTFEPASETARGALTGCCGATTTAFAYDHRTTWRWTDAGLFGSGSHYGGGSGRGRWHVHA